MVCVDTVEMRIITPVPASFRISVEEIHATIMDERVTHKQSDMWMSIFRSVLSGLFFWLLDGVMYDGNVIQGHYGISKVWA